MLKQRNNELFEQNLRLQQERQNIPWQSPSFEQQPEPQQKQPIQPAPPSVKAPDSDTKNYKSK